LPSSITVEPPPLPGRRPAVHLFAILGMDVWLMGGQYTLNSPVAETSSGAAADANRPLFMPATQAEIAVEVRSE
jgi:hypothetical protein